MYLPKSALIKALSKNGYNKFDYFYLSGEAGLTKKSGNLYKKFLEDEKLKPEEILHFGDNYKCDILMAKENNINAYLIHKKSELFLSNRKNERFEKLYKKNENSLEISIILALLSEKYSDKAPLNSKENYYYDFGYCIAGAIGYGLCKFISDNVSDGDEILCIARDGYYLEKILNIINPNLSTYYVYAQRILKNKLGLEENDKAEDFEARREEYKKYLQSTGIDFKKNIVVIDSAASSFSAQRIIEAILDKKTLGLYSMVDKKKNIEKYNINCKTWAFCKKEISDITALIEFIFMAPEPPVIDIKNNKPIYMKEVHPKEKILNNLAPLIAEGMLDFVRDFMNRFRTIEIGFSAKTVNCYMQNFILNLSKIDKDIFKNNFYAANVENTKYLPLLRKIYKLSGHKQFYLQRIIYNIEIKILKKYKK